MANPYVPSQPIQAGELPVPSIGLIMMEAWMEHQIRSAKTRNQPRMIADMYEVADQLEALAALRGSSP